MNFYFLACMPMHILPCLGIAQLAKAINPSVRSHLILPHHSYLDHVNLDYASGFDQIHELPYCSFERDIRKGLSRARRFREAAENLSIEPDSIYFFSESDDPLVHLLLEKRLKGARNVLRVKFIVATPGSWMNLDLQLLTKKTILGAGYSFVLRVPLVRFYRSRDSRAISGPIHNLPCEALIVFETARADLAPRGLPSAIRMPYPARFIQGSSLAAVPSLPSGSVIYFLSTEDSVADAEMDGDEYWRFHGRILGAIAREYPGVHKYVKLHPLMPGESFRPSECVGWEVLPKEFSAEEIFLQNRKEIQAVYGTSSGSPMMAACLGIRSYVTYPLLCVPSWLKRYWDEYFDVDVKKLLRVNQLDELKGGGAEGEVAPDVADGNDWKRWESCLGLLMGKVRAGRCEGSGLEAQTVGTTG